MVWTNRRHQVPGQAPVTDALGKKVSKVALPSFDGCTPYPAKPLEALQSNIRIFPLAKGTDQQQHRRPVNPAPPKTHRWR
jgi:hypothetical protein